MSSNKKKTPVVKVVLCDSSSSLRLVPYDESAHLDAYDAFMRDPQMLLDTKTEATTKDTWRAILSNNQTIESGVEQFMIDVLGDDGKRTCIGDVSSHDVPSCDVEEDEDDDEEEEEEEEEGAVSKEISICIFDKRYQRRGYARAAVKLFVTFVEHRCDEWYDAMEDKTKTTTTSVKPRSFLAKIDRKNTASMALFRDRFRFRVHGETTRAERRMGRAGGRTRAELFRRDRVRFEDWNDEIWNDDVHQTNGRCDSRGNATLGRLMMRWSRPERETPCLASHLFGEEKCG